MNPEPDQIGRGGDGGNPLSVNSLETDTTWEWLSRILNRCQRHHCSTAYCLRINKKAVEQAREHGEQEPEPECRNTRLGLPQEVVLSHQMRFENFDTTQRERCCQEWTSNSAVIFLKMSIKIVILQRNSCYRLFPTTNHGGLFWINSDIYHPQLIYTIFRSSQCEIRIRSYQ